MPEREEGKGDHTQARERAGWCNQFKTSVPSRGAIALVAPIVPSPILLTFNGILATYSYFVRLYEVLRGRKRQGGCALPNQKARQEREREKVRKEKKRKGFLGSGQTRDSNLAGVVWEA